MSNSVDLIEEKCTDLLVPNPLNLSPIWSGSETIATLLCPPRQDANGVFISEFVRISEYLRREGVSRSNIKAGLLLCCALNSVRLGCPLSIILIADDGATGSHLLRTCTRIMPEGSFHEIRDLKTKQLYLDQSYYSNRVLICHDVDEVRRAVPDLLSLITNGFSERQIETKSQFSNHIETIRAEYRTSFVGIQGADQKGAIDHPMILKVPVYGTSCGPEQAFAKPSDDGEPYVIAKRFERLRCRIVRNPFYPRILRAIASQQPEHLRDKLSIFEKVISLASIIDDPPSFDQREVLSAFFRLKTTYSGFELNNNRNETKLLSCTESLLDADPIAYYFASLLLDGLITVGCQRFTGMQITTFEVLKAINFAKLKAAFIDQNDIFEKLNMARQPAYCASVGEISKQVSKQSSSGFIPVPEIEKVLNQLIGLKVIGIRKGVSGSSHGYYVLVPEIKTYLKFTLPSEHSSDRIKVMNPLTFKIDLI